MIDVRKIIAEEIQKNPVGPDSIVYCDMDGVLVDFATGAIKLSNDIISGNAKQEWVAQSKSMRKAIRAIKEKDPSFIVKSSQDLDIPEVRSLMFAAIGFNPGEFFSMLPPLDDGLNVLWPYLNSLPNKVVLLTAPVGNRRGVDSMTAGEGKKLWAQEWLSPSPADVIISPARSKSDHASSGSVSHILIDDKASTIRSWNESGYGILHITGDSSSTVSRLKEIL